MTMKTDSVVYWPVLRWADHLLPRVDKFFVFHPGDRALLFTQDLEVFAVGENDAGCLGVGHTAKVTKPEEVVELRGVKIEMCKMGDCRVMLLTKDGVLYGWGSNEGGQVGCGNMVNQHRPVVVMTGVSKVACGLLHTTALCRDDTTWCWGVSDSYLRPDATNVPVELTQLRGQRVVQVDSTAFHNVALTDQNRVFVWIIITNMQIIFSEVSLPSGLTVASLICGHQDLIALTVDNRIYRYDSHWHSIEVDELVDTVTYFFPTNNILQYILKLKSGCVTVWSPEKVIPTSLTSVADAYALYLYYAVTPTLTTLPAHCISEQVMRSIAHFNNPVKSNLTLSFEYKQIYLNTKIASQLSPYLAEQIKGQWKNVSTVSIRDYSFVTYFTYLQYVHCGTVGMIETEWVCELLQLSMIAGEASLHGHCLHLITTHMANRATELIRSEHWLSVVEQLDTFFMVTNAVYYLQLAEQTEDDEMTEKIWKLIATRSKSTAQKVMAMLYRLSQPTSLPLIAS